MKLPETPREPETKDYVVALVIVILALMAYVRTLAPDILYGDSAEFQTLAYTLGVTHSTGYPTYLFLGRLVGFLPINTPAWRISLLSAICAAITVSGVYLLAHGFTRSQVGAVLGAITLGISYTFWSQAIIAEVYLPGMAFLVLIMLLLSHWHIEPQKRNLSLLVAALLAGIGFGVHASVWLIAPTAIAFVLWTLGWRRASSAEWLRSLSSGFIGALLGFAIFVTAFLISDRLNSPTSFIRTTLEPSRVFWNLQPEDFDSSFNHLRLTVISAQWGDALFPEDDNFSFKREFEKFNARLTGIEFPPMVLVVSLVGFVVMLVTHPLRGAFFALTFLVPLFFILNYQVPDKYVFYLSLYIPLAVAAGAGMGFTLERIQRNLQTVRGRSGQVMYLLAVLFFVTMVVHPTAATRWQAIRDGVANFVTDDYPFPVQNLKEPRSVAQMRLAGVEADAVFVLEWRGLFTTAYLAHVEKGLTNTLFFEAMPRGNNGKMASSLVAQLNAYLLEGRPVYVEQKYPGLEENFRFLPVSGNLYKLSLRG